MIKHFFFIIFIYCLNAYSIMSDDIYKLSDLKYKGYDIIYSFKYFRNIIPYPILIKDISNLIYYQDRISVKAL